WPPNPSAPRRHAPATGSSRRPAVHRGEIAWPTVLSVPDRSPAWKALRAAGSRPFAPPGTSPDCPALPVRKQEAGMNLHWMTLTQPQKRALAVLCEYGPCPLPAEVG